MRGQSIRRLVLVAVGVLVWSGNHALAQKMPAEFVAAYGPALEAMRMAYSQGTVQGTLQSEYPTKGRSIDRRFTLRLAGNTSRIDARVTAQKGMGATVGGTDIFLAMPGASMQAYRRDNGEVANQPFDEDGYSQANTSIKELCPISFPYTMGTQGTILTMLQSGDVRITSFKKGKRDGEPMIQIKYIQQVDPDGQYGPWNGTLLISPTEGYALRSFTRTAGEFDRQVTYSGSLSYTLNVDGVPLLQQFERSEQRGSGGVVVERQNMAISEFDTQPPRNYLFSADGF
ncbi:MAG: hypothetical protein WD845_13025 [Pirellulales bacterium]